MPARSPGWSATSVRPYPFEKFDFVLAPAFPFGGMEHPGTIFCTADGLHLPGAPHPAPPARPLFHHTPRGGPPVVRRSGHHAVVRRSVAQGRDSRPSWPPRPWRTSSRRADAWKTFYLGNKTVGVAGGSHGGHASALAGARQPRPGQEQLRRDRLQQGPGGAQAARVPHEQYGLFRPDLSLPRTVRVRQRRLAATCSARSARRPDDRSTRSVATSCCGPGCPSSSRGSRSRMEGSRG